MENLKTLRITKGLSQAAMAEELNVSQNTISQWESGVRQPDNGTLIKLAEYFNVSVDYLLGKTDDPRTSAQLLADSIKNRKAKLVAHGGDGVKYIDHISREEYESFFPESAKKCILSNGIETTEITKEEFEKMKAFLKMIRE